MKTDFELRAALEALLVVAETPLNLLTLAGALEVPIGQVKAELDALIDDYDSANEGTGRGFELREVGGGWRLYVRQSHDWGVRQLVANENPSKLSHAALETLSVIAYRQPVSRGQVSSIRGVNVDSVVRTLISRGPPEPGGFVILFILANIIQNVRLIIFEVVGQNHSLTILACTTFATTNPDPIRPCLTIVALLLNPILLTFLSISLSIIVLEVIQQLCIFKKL